VARSISVATVIRDESAELAECLDHIHDLAQEISIVDTGSLDSTVEIARRFDAKISHFIWCDEADAVRNESLRACTCDWIFILNANERLLPEDIAKIRALADGPLTAAYRFVIRNYTNTTTLKEFHPCQPNDPVARRFAGWYPSSMIRLLPTRAGTRFEGLLYEKAQQSLEQNGVRLVDSDIVIQHYPYLHPPKHIIGNDTMGNTPQELATADDALDPVKNGNRYREQGDFHKAVAAYRQSLRHNPANPIVLGIVGNLLRRLRQPESAKRALRLALELNPEMRNAWRDLGLIYADEKEWQLAIECFRQGMAVDPEWVNGHRYLSVALEQTGHLAVAVVAARKALEANPKSAENLRVYIHQIRRLERRAEARELLQSLIEGGVETPGLHNAIGELCFYDNLHEEAIEHFTHAGQAGFASAYNNLGVVYYHQKQYAKAKEAFENCLENDPTHQGAQTNLDKVNTHFTDQ